MLASTLRTEQNIAIKNFDLQRHSAVPLEIQVQQSLDLIGNSSVQIVVFCTSLRWVKQNPAILREYLRHATRICSENGYIVIIEETWIVKEINLETLLAKEELLKNFERPKPMDERSGYVGYYLKKTKPITPDINV